MPNQDRKLIALGRHRSNGLRFIDLFAGLGGFHLALSKLGHRCTFASEIDESLCDLYEKNFPIRPFGNLRTIAAASIPKHDILCAGFPCQPFSKAGEQKGTKCKLWGDLFSGHVLRVIKHHRPTYLLMENVANLEKHDGGELLPFADCFRGHLGVARLILGRPSAISATHRYRFGKLSCLLPTSMRSVSVIARVRKAVRVPVASAWHTCR